MVPFEDKRYARLERMLERDASNRLDARGLATSVWSAAVLGRPRLLDALISHSDAQLREATLQEHAVVTWALGRLQAGRLHPQALGFIAHSCSRQLEQFRPERLALRVLHDLSATATQADGPLHTAATPLRQLHTVNPRSLTRLMCGFAGCQHPPPRRLVAAIGREAARQMPLFDASSLAFLLSAHAKLGLAPHAQLLQKAAPTLIRTLPAAGGGPLAAALSVWSFARLRLHPGARLLAVCDAELAQAAAPGLLAVGTARLAGAVWGFGALGVRPSSWPLLAAALARRELRPADKSTLRVGLDRLQASTGVQEGDAALRLAVARAPAQEGAAAHHRDVWLSCRPLLVSRSAAVGT